MGLSVGLTVDPGLAEETGEAEDFDDGEAFELEPGIMLESGLSSGEASATTDGEGVGEAVATNLLL